MRTARSLATRFLSRRCLGFDPKTALGVIGVTSASLLRGKNGVRIGEPVHAGRARREGRQFGQPRVMVHGERVEELRGKRASIRAVPPLFISAQPLHDMPVYGFLSACK
jgi:hypothetical protein